MSAIGGIVTKSNKVTTSVLKKMLDASTHRGSDTQKIWNIETAGFIHKQLWTTPESLNETQPLQCKEKNFILTADARLDNRDELKHTLASPVEISDAELILQSYIKWGKHCVEHLIGDFAFSIWDIKNHTLYCARDHLGIKPLYYSANDKAFYFASEIGAIFAASNIQKKANDKEIDNFKQVRAITCDATFFQYIKRLLPGHYLIYKNETIQTKRYWYPEKIAINKTISLDDASLQLRSLLQKAVDTRLRSTYGVGCELSGGVDSSSILALALNSSFFTSVTPFSNLYGNLSCDESQYIEEMAKMFDTHPVTTQANQLDFSKEFSLQNYYELAPDWPAKGSFLDAKAEMQEAKKRNIRVILTGQGGDHIASGNYSRLTDYFIQRDYKRLWKELHANHFSYKTFINYFILPLLSEKSKKNLKTLLGRTKTKRFSAMHNCFEMTSPTLSYMQKTELNILCGVTNQLWMDSNPYTTIGGIYDIEYRHPFFDKRVVEFMLSLPPWMKVKGEENKIILRKSMKDLLPEKIYTRNDKAEFTDIIALQLKQCPNRESLINANFKQKVNFEENISYNEINKEWNSLLTQKWLLTNGFSK